MTEITINDTGLACEIYRFRFNVWDGTLILSSYHKMARPTKRHDWRAITIYTTSDNRNNTITLDEVPFTDEIKALAIDGFTKNIEVVRLQRNGKVTK